MATLLHAQSKIELLTAREYFFKCIFKALVMEPMTVDVLFGADTDYVTPQLLSMNVEFGSMVIDVSPNFIGEGDESRYFYTIAVMGNVLRIGIFMPVSKLLTLPVIDNHREQLFNVWNGAEFAVMERDLGVLYEWTFMNFDPSCWANAEKYVLGMRHLHFCVLKLLHNMVREVLGPTIRRN